MNPPRILIVEDDPVSADFLCAVLRDRYEVTSCAGLADAAGHIAAQGFDLLLVDLHLQDGHGIDLLRALHDRSSHASTPLRIALSAEIDTTLVESLRSLGCSDVLEKPMTIQTLQEAVSRAFSSVPRAACTSADGIAESIRDSAVMTWDDDAALRALGGQRSTLERLRDLMRADLPAQRERMVQAHRNGAFDELDAELHRLKAACGFCGTPALAMACDGLRRHRDQGSLDAMLAAMQDVLGPSP